MNEIIHGDAMHHIKTIADDTIDLIFTDPPYNTTSLKMDAQSFNISDYMEEFKRILKPNGWFFCFGSVEIYKLISDYFRFKFQYIWKKPNGILQHGNTIAPIIKHENLWVFIQPELKKMNDLTFYKSALRVKGAPYKVIRGAHKSEFKTQLRDDDYRITDNTGYRDGTSILEFPNKPLMKKSERTPHPTQKPVDLCKVICKAYCKEGGTILDPFAGSGTIPLAARNTGRQYIATEINKEYHDMAIKRFGYF